MSEVISDVHRRIKLLLSWPRMIAVCHDEVVLLRPRRTSVPYSFGDALIHSVAQGLIAPLKTRVRTAEIQHRRVSAVRVARIMRLTSSIYPVDRCSGTSWATMIAVMPRSMNGNVTWGFGVSQRGGERIQSSTTKR
jgi:hypothetical protein